MTEAFVGDYRILVGLTPRRFIIHIIVLSIWTAALGYAALTGQIKSPVTVSSSPSIHFVSASTQCDPSITCAVSDIFQTSCSITSGLSVMCGNTSIQTGEKYNILANVSGGVASSTHYMAGHKLQRHCHSNSGYRHLQS